MSRIRPLSAPYFVDVLETSGLRRVLSLTGRVAAHIELDLRREGEQVLRVDGRLVQHRSSLLGYNTLFQFELGSSRGRVPASLETHVTLWRGIVALRLRVRSQVVYSEGAFPGEAGQAITLPIPSDHPCPSQVGLPTPAGPPLIQLGDLPLPPGAAVRGWEAVSPLRDAARRQMRQRVSTAGAACLLSGILFGGLHSIGRMREEQLYGRTATVVSTPRPVQPPRRKPMRKKGPYKPVPDPTPYRLSGR